MNTYAQAPATTQASYVRQALAVEGGHLFLGPNGAVLHFAPGARASGFPCEAIKAACLAAGLPVIDCRAVPFRPLYAVVVEGPTVAVGKAPDPRPWHSLSDASAASRKCSAFRCAARADAAHLAGFGELAHVAAFYHAAGAELLNVPGVSDPSAGAAP